MSNVLLLIFWGIGSKKRLKNQAKQNYSEAANDIVPKKANDPVESPQPSTVKEVYHKNQGLGK